MYYPAESFRREMKEVGGLMEYRSDCNKVGHDMQRYKGYTIKGVFRVLGILSK